MVGLRKVVCMLALVLCIAYNAIAIRDYGSLTNEVAAHSHSMVMPTSNPQHEVPHGSNPIQNRAPPTAAGSSHPSPPPSVYHTQREVPAGGDPRHNQHPPTSPHQAAVYHTQREVPAGGDPRHNQHPPTPTHPVHQMDANVVSPVQKISGV
ncbi:hypothetical protein FRX31_029871 [Thalictrum thalictroides]|uniref:Transmembrane protein n=1 Tax=Thalictrum thalictroides TaxID=46969 RepID=A0A7J6V7H2_THATH|nr:hypothetical protein FRX31_029871 [Thalictrum thalictroides]